jgi:hypothetical protein
MLSATPKSSRLDRHRDDAAAEGPTCHLHEVSSSAAHSTDVHSVPAHWSRAGLGCLVSEALRTSRRPSCPLAALFLLGVSRC